METIGLILSAGQSSRMQEHKALLPWFECTLIEWEIVQMKKAGIQHIFVVLGYESEKIFPIIKNFNIHTIINKTWWKGRTNSIVTGLTNIKSTLINETNYNLLIQNVDQPIKSNDLKILIEASRNSIFDIIQPTYNKELCHPLIINKDHFNNLLNIEKNKTTLRDFTKNYQIKKIKINAQYLQYNLNTPDEYKKALENFK
jgi:CTP:molybdopterin cytidylyltransferase MocA